MLLNPTVIEAFGQEKPWIPISERDSTGEGRLEWTQALVCGVSLESLC